jgi:hypothetical protein
MAGEFLRDLDIRPAGHQAADVGMPQGVEVGHAVRPIPVRQEGRLPALPLLVFRPARIGRR